MRFWVREKDSVEKGSAADVRLIVCLLHVGGELTQKRDEGSRGYGKRSIAPVGKSKFAIHWVLKINQFDPASVHFVACE